MPHDRVPPAAIDGNRLHDQLDRIIELLGQTLDETPSRALRSSIERSAQVATEREPSPSHRTQDPCRSSAASRLSLSPRVAALIRGVDPPPAECDSQAEHDDSAHLTVLAEHLRLDKLHPSAGNSAGLLLFTERCARAYETPQAPDRFCVALHDNDGRPIGWVEFRRVALLNHQVLFAASALHPAGAGCQPPAPVLPAYSVLPKGGIVF